MRYVIERGGEQERFDVPEGTVLKVTSAEAQVDAGKMPIYEATFVSPGGELLAVFGHLGAIYPESFIPPKKEFANNVEVPKGLGWIGTGV